MSIFHIYLLISVRFYYSLFSLSLCLHLLTASTCASVPEQCYWCNMRTFVAV